MALMTRLRGLLQRRRAQRELDDELARMDPVVLLREE
jgi:hypothetical protein